MFKSSRKQQQRPNRINLTCITDGSSRSFFFDPARGPIGQLRRTIQEFDGEGYPLFFAEQRIDGLPVRVRDAAITAKEAEYKKMRSNMLEQVETPTTAALSSSKLEAVEKKAKNKRAARAVKPKKEAAENE